MSESTRRAFLGLLAHLPLVGAWFAKPAPTRTPFSEMVAHILEEKKTMRIIRWIPIKERLPHSAGLTVLVADKYGWTGVATRGPFENWPDILAIKENSGITHWALLPEAPTEPPSN